MTLSSVVMILAPVWPNGWPSAIAPPCVLSLSSGMSHSSMIGITWAANASLSSTVSTSSIFIWAPSSPFLIAPIGATPMYSGSLPKVAAVTMRALGVRPSSLARSSDITRTAAAPSLSGHELPAVTLPSGRKAGSSCDSFSSDLARTRAVVLGRLASIGQRDRNDLAVEEPGLLGGHRELLRALRVLVHVGAADLVAVGDVLGRQAHRDVGVGLAVLALQLFVLIRLARGLGALVVAAHPLDAGGDIGV